jgi:hypothetical protein
MPLSVLIFLPCACGRLVRAWWAAMALGEPAVLMTTTLGYIDVFFAIPAVGAVVAASTDAHGWRARSYAAATTKPQGLFVGPVVALALWNAGSPGGGARRVRGGAASALSAAVVAAQVIAAGKIFQMQRTVAMLAGHDMLSALAFNIWWIVSYVFMAAAARGGGLRAAISARAEIVQHTYAMARGFPDPRVVALLLLAAAVLWALKTAWHARDLGLHAGLAAFVVVACFHAVGAGAREPLLLALPLLAVASARSAFSRVFMALTLTFALNLYLPSACAATRRSL